MNVAVTPHLPLIEVEPVTRTADEVVDRMMTLYAVIAYSAGFDRKQARSWLESEGLIERLTPNEAKLLRGHRRRFREWEIRTEAVFSLMWTVGLVDQMDLRKKCPDDLVYSLPDLHVAEPAAEWRSRAIVRSVEELLLMRDLAYCLHWAVVEAEFKGRRLAKVDMASVSERRQALEWLFCQEDWDDVPLDT